MNRTAQWGQTSFLPPERRRARCLASNGDEDFQNVPVLSVDGKPLGILDIRDALKALFEREELQVQLLATISPASGTSRAGQA